MWKFVKLAKIIALLGFFLPWMTVSCASQKILTASGWNLTFGKFDVANLGDKANQIPGNGAINTLLAIALIIIIIGLVLSFQSLQKGAIAVIATSIAAIVIILFAAHNVANGFSTSMAAAAAKGEASGSSDALAQSMGSSMEKMIQINWEWGYWLTLVALALAGLLSWMALRGKSFSGLMNSE